VYIHWIERCPLSLDCFVVSRSQDTLSSLKWYGTRGQISNHNNQILSEFRIDL
jgi:hypothetical protein